MSDHHHRASDSDSPVIANSGSEDGPMYAPFEHPEQVGSNVYHQDRDRDTSLVDPAPYLVQIKEIKDLSNKRGIRLEKLEREVDEKDKDITKLKREAGEKDKQIALMNSQLGSEHNEGPRDRKSNEKLFKRISELEDENKQLKTDVTKSENENHDLKVRLKSKKLWTYTAGALILVCTSMLALLLINIPCKSCPGIISNKPCSDTDPCTKQINSLTLEIKDLETVKMNCESALGKLSSESNTCRIEKADLETKDKKLELEKDKVNDDLRGCRLDKFDTEKKVKNLESEKDNTKDDSKVCKQENAKSKKRIKKLETELSNMNDDINGCRREKADSENKIKKLETDKSNMNNDLKGCRREKADIEETLKNRIKSETADIFKEVDNLEKEISDIRVRGFRLETEKEQLANEKGNLEDKVNKMKDNEDELHRKNRELEKKIIKVTGKQNKLNAEVDVLQNKLSECQIEPAGAPDSMLPLNIGQEFKTLYDQHYTMALDELEDTHGTLNVKETVKMFLNILKTAHNLTAYYTQLHINSMKISSIALQIEVPDKTLPDKQNSLFINSTLSKLEWKQFYEIRQQSAWGMLDSLTNELGEGIAREFLVDSGSMPKMMTYIKQCISLCWKTQLHREPVYIDFYEPENTEEFYYEIFKPFMYQSGNYIDFVVWPPMFEKKGGHMIAKGIAERKDNP